jgi:uncharacterized peroxidase-related enzyme
MTKILPLSNNNALPEVVKMYTEIESIFGMIPNLFQTQAHFVPLLKTSWESVKLIMLTQGSLSRKVKETIAVLISKDNSCQYCFGAHSMMLRTIGVTDKELEKIHEDELAEAGFSPKEVILIGLARAANLKPHNIDPSLFTKLREARATDAEIVEALAVMGIFTFFNKFIDTLEVAPEL